MTNRILDANVSDDLTCRIKDLQDLLGLTRLTVWKWQKTGRLPPPLAIPNRSSRDALLWRVGDIREWAEKVGLFKTSPTKVTPIEAEIAIAKGVDGVWDKGGDSDATA